MGFLHWHALSEEEVAARLNASHKGLSAQEARRRLERHGYNRIDLGSQTTPWQILIAQFKDFMVMTLLAATAVAALLGETTDALAILAILVLNAILGFIQEYRAEQSLKALDGLSAPQAAVLRDGRTTNLAAAELVVGDVITLTSGQRVPADARLLEAKDLEIDESLLTGESLAVRKQSGAIFDSKVPLAERKNLLFMGTMVQQGRARALVVATGMSTEMGSIASLLAEAGGEATPLQRRLDRLGRYLVAACLLLCSLVTVLGIWRGEAWFRMFLVGVSLAVAAMPEGLPAVVTVALALGVQRMSKRAAIVRRLPSVEALGSATVICADKTGTLTMNQMTVQALSLGRKSVYRRQDERASGLLQHVEGPPGEAQRELALLAGALCNDAELDRSEKGKQRWRGDATEIALLQAAVAHQLDVDRMRRQFPRLDEKSFSSARRRMSVVVRHEQGQRIYSKGAPDTLLGSCRDYLEAGRRQPLTPNAIEQLQAQLDSMTQAGLRVLALAYRELPAQQESWSESDLTLIGYVGLWDPPRPQARSAVNRCLQSGIIPVMITGDHPRTAETIARHVGILPPNGGRVVTGSELDEHDERWLRRCLRENRVFARMSPQHKLTLVRMLRKAGHVVAMTGDGVNDAPAVKEADIGIAMGLSGTDVTREAADMVLADDNFATIVAAVEEGRTIYENMRKFIRYLLSCNVGEVLVMLIGVFLGWPLPLLPMQVLWVNLVTDGLPALALGVEASQPEYMRQPPRAANESIFARGLARRILFRGLVMAVITSVVFIWSLTERGDLQYARTMALVTLIFAQLFHAFECRFESSHWPRGGLWSNPWLVLACLTSGLSTVLVVYHPSLQPYFQTMGLLLADWMIALLAAVGSGLLLRIIPAPFRQKGLPRRRWNRLGIQEQR